MFLLLHVPVYYIATQGNNNALDGDNKTNFSIETSSNFILDRRVF